MVIFSRLSAQLEFWGLLLFDLLPPLFSPSFLAGNRAGSRVALLSFILFFTFAVDSLTCGVPDRSLLRCLGFVPPKGATRKQLLVIAVLQIKVKIRGCINVFK